MQILEEKLRAPELRVTQWITGVSHTLASLREKIVLVDFWDYTCINCLHTLPYLKAWHERYANAGLVILGIHAPEFQFAHQANLVEKALRDLDIPYPIALDNQFQTWQSFANRAWPAKYLIDAQGYIRAFHHGEGAYAEFERSIQKLLLENNPLQSFPDPLPPFHDFDRPGAMCLRPTPELYCGWGRGEIGNSNNRLEDTTRPYRMTSVTEPNTLYLEGIWHQRKEYVEAVETPARIYLQYQARQINVVLEPVAQNAIIRISVDGQAIPVGNQGGDVYQQANHTVLSTSNAQMYDLIRHPDFEHHQLSLEIETPGVKVYTFTFVGCPASA